MRATKSLLGLLGGMLVSALLLSCGGSGGNLTTGNSGGSGGGGGSGGSNVATVNVNDGATGNSINTLFVSVTLCVPGSSTCQTINNIQVDTGSYGLRILAPVLTLTLPTQTAAAGGTLIECTNFVDGFTWGPVALADVKISGESASSVPVQVIGDKRFPNPSSDCADPSTPEEDTVDAFGANGILGVGPTVYDCGTYCIDNMASSGYFACTSTSASSCTASTATLAQQVQSVVAKFTTDNNGVIIELPAVANPVVGTLALSGSLIFGIDTQSNNASGTQTVLTTDMNGEITIDFEGTQYNQSFIDSGTNGTYFTSALPACTQKDLAVFYCPTTEQSLSAKLTGINLVSAVVNFNIGNTYTMLNANNTFAVFPEIGGTYPGGTPTFDFGLPFFYGRRVAVAMEGQVTSVGTGPYFAF